MFNAKIQRQKVVEWIKNWFIENGDGCNAVIGISGGKDSTVAAALCVEALGRDRVIGVLMPNGEQKDIDDSYRACQIFGIKKYTFNIQQIERAFRYKLLLNDFNNIAEQSVINLAPRIRMAMLYFISQSRNGRVCNTCNLSEDYVGYATKYGDAAGDFAPLKSFTTEEVIAIGREIGLPEKLLTKAPADGLCGKTDEDNLGFTYEVLNKYIRTGEIEDAEAKEKIDRLHRINAFKERVIDRYEFE